MGLARRSRKLYTNRSSKVVSKPLTPSSLTFGPTQNAQTAPFHIASLLHRDNNLRYLGQLQCVPRQLVHHDRSDGNLDGDSLGSEHQSRFEDLLDGI